MLLSALLSLQLSYAAPGPVAATADSWPFTRGDQQQTGRSPASLTLPLASAWTLDLGAPIHSSPVVDGSHVYIGTEGGVLVAVDRTTGKEAWRHSFEGPVEAAPFLLGDLVLVGSHDGRFTAFQRKDGAVKWTRDLGAKIVASATYLPPTEASPGTVFIGGYDGILHALDPDTGADRWTYTTGSYLYGSPALIDGTAILGGCDGFVHFLDAHTGAPRSTLEVGAYVGASPAAEGAIAWVGHFGNHMIAFPTAGGSTLWDHHENNFPFLSSPAVTDKIVIVGSRDRVIRGLDKQTGEVWWYWPTRGKVDGSIVVTPTQAIAGSADGRLYVLNLEDGDALWNADVGAPIRSTPALASGWIYIGDESGTLHGFAPKSQRKKGKKSPSRTR